MYCCLISLNKMSPAHVGEGREGRGGGVSPLPPRGHHSPLSRRWLPAMPPYYNKQFRCTKKAMEIMEKRECRLERIRKENEANLKDF